MLRIIRARPLRGAAANAGCEVVAPLADALRMPPLLRSTTSTMRRLRGSTMAISSLLVMTY